MKVADHTLLTPFISAERQTGRRGEARQGKRRRVAELLQITAFPSLHRACQACKHRPSRFFFPFFQILFHSLLLLLPLPPLLSMPLPLLLLLLSATATRSGVTLIGSGEFKGPVSGWGCRRTGQRCKQKQHTGAYHRAAWRCRAAAAAPRRRNNNTVGLD